MMRERTVVYGLKKAFAKRHAFDTLSVNIAYVDGLSAKSIRSASTSKDKVLSSLFDLSLRGYYVSSMTSLFFRWEQDITLYLQKSDDMRTNIGSSLMEQIAMMIDQTQRNGK